MVATKKAKGKGKVEVVGGGFALTDGPDVAWKRLTAFDAEKAGNAEVRKAIADIRLILETVTGG